MFQSDTETWSLKLFYSVDSIRVPLRFCMVVITFWLTLGVLNALGQGPQPVARFDRQGKVQSIKAGQLIVAHGNKATQTYKIQNKGEEALSLEGGRYIFRAPADIVVRGMLPVKLAERGMIVTTRVQMNKSGKLESPVETIRLLASDTQKLGLRFEEEPSRDKFTACRIIGRLIRASEKSMVLEMPKSNIARRGKLTLKFAPKATLQIEADDLDRVQPGDQVEVLRGVKLSTGDFVVRKIEIRMTGERKTVTASFHQQLEQKYSQLSDAPGRPRDVRSENFLLHTDISEREASILLEKLEQMFSLISRYYYRKPPSQIECYVVRDIRNWSRQLPRAGGQKIIEGAGVTLSRTRGNVTRSIVYSCDKHGVVQHEAVHAFCAQAFGSAGPVWYAEGMAEMGQYWKPDQKEVDIDPVVIEYLTNGNKKSLREIVKAGQITGDSWRAYAWRWALCHLLASNRNYAPRFKKLGLNLMTKEPDSFDAAFGKIADEISFEYDQFTQNIGNGYRVDLCEWDWKKKARKVSSGRMLAQVKAKSGWQATGVKVEQGVSYDFVTKGQWAIDDSGEFNADGNERGGGRLVGVIFNNYRLVEEIDLGRQGRFVPESDGQLFLRCRDSWTELSDNDGVIKVYFRRTPKSVE